MRELAKCRKPELAKCRKFDNVRLFSFHTAADLPQKGQRRKKVCGLRETEHCRIFDGMMSESYKRGARWSKPKQPTQQ